VALVGAGGQQLGEGDLVERGDVPVVEVAQADDRFDEPGWQHSQPILALTRR